MRSNFDMLRSPSASRLGRPSDLGKAMGLQPVVGGMDTDSATFLIRKLVQDEMAFYQREIHEELAQVKADVTCLEASIADCRRQALSSLQDMRQAPRAAAPTHPGGFRMSSVMQGAGAPLFGSSSSPQPRGLQGLDGVLSDDYELRLATEQHEHLLQHTDSVKGLLQSIMDTLMKVREKELSIEGRVTSLEGQLGDHAEQRVQHVEKVEQRLQHAERSVNRELALVKSDMAGQQRDCGMVARHTSLTEEVDSIRSALAGAQTRIREVFDKSAVAAQEILIVTDGQTTLKRSMEDKIARVEEAVRANTLNISMQEDTVRSTFVKIKHIEEFLGQFQRRGM